MGKTALTAMEPFCGAGGLSEGFRQAGFHVLAGNDLNKFPGETFAATHAEATFLDGPLEGISAKDFLKATGLDLLQKSGESLLTRV